ncbi:MAG: SPOR domain-containing protein [Sphingomicrobium sp.]
MRNRLKLALAGIALTLAAPAGAQSVKAGIEAWQKGDFAAAIGAWRPLAARGDADAAFNLGQAYRLGKGVPLSLANAQSWYEKAARAGHVDAATSLGILLFQNGNRTSAMRWLKQSAEAGEPRALLLYGTALYNGDGVPRDPVTAYAYVSRAAAQGLAPARATLADMDDMMPIEQRQQGVALAKAAVGAKTAAKPAAAKAPAVKPAPTPKPVAIAAGGAWRVQLGAFSKRGSAEALFKSLAAGPLAGRQAYYVAAGAVTRLQAGPFASKAEAGAACARLSARGQACFPVAAR